MKNRLINEVAGVNPEIINISRDILEQIFDHISNIDELNTNIDTEIVIDTTITFKGKAFDIPIFLGLIRSDSYYGSVSGGYDNDLKYIFINISLPESNYTLYGFFKYIKYNSKEILKTISHEIKHYLDHNYFLNYSTNIKRDTKYVSPRHNRIYGSPHIHDFYTRLYVTNDVELRAIYEEIYSLLIENNVLKSDFLKNLYNSRKYEIISNTYKKYSYIDFLHAVISDFEHLKEYADYLLANNKFKNEHEKKIMVAHYILRIIRHNLIKNEYDMALFYKVENSRSILNSRFYYKHLNKYSPLTKEDINLNNIFFTEKIDMMKKNSGKFLKKIAKLYSLLPNG